jgi:uncharacterized membrane protein YecN with MAPEG domain
MRGKDAETLFAVVSVLVLLSTSAEAVTERQKRDCKADYNRYCKQYKLGTEALRACMSRNIRKVSSRCIAALVAGGDMTQAQADKILKERARAAKVRKQKATRR